MKKTLDNKLSVKTLRIKNIDESFTPIRKFLPIVKNVMPRERAYLMYKGNKINNAMYYRDFLCCNNIY